MLSDRCLSVLSVALVYCGQTVGRIKMKHSKQIGLDPGHNVLDGGDPDPPLLQGHSPQFSAHHYCGETAAWIKMSLDMEVGLGRGHRLGSCSPPQKVSVHVYCGQTVAHLSYC